MGKLIPMIDFVLSENLKDTLDMDAIDFVKNYARFLKLPLTLGMFVPVDRDGKPYDLNEVEAWKKHEHYSRFYKEELAFFEDAKENVLFEGFELKREAAFSGVVQRISDGQSIYVDDRTLIENIVKLDIELTESAKKRIRKNNFIYL